MFSAVKAPCILLTRNLWAHCAFGQENKLFAALDSDDTLFTVEFKPIHRYVSAGLYQMTLELSNEGNVRFGWMGIEIPVMSFDIDKGGASFMLLA